MARLGECHGKFRWILQNLSIVDEANALWCASDNFDVWVLNLVLRSAVAENLQPWFNPL
jgi:hypothetical protein